MSTHDHDVKLCVNICKPESKNVCKHVCKQNKKVNRCLRFQSYSFGNSEAEANFQNRSLHTSGLY